VRPGLGGRLDYPERMAALTFTVLAHSGHGHEDGAAALAAIGVAAIVIPLIVLVVVGRLFLRAARRDDDAPVPD
jgi:ABC-type glycerol-3-phosphate transport system permease component